MHNYSSYIHYTIQHLTFVLLARLFNSAFSIFSLENVVREGGRGAVVREGGREEKRERGRERGREGGRGGKGRGREGGREGEEEGTQVVREVKGEGRKWRGGRGRKETGGGGETEIARVRASPAIEKVKMQQNRYQMKCWN